LKTYETNWCWEAHVESHVSMKSVPYIILRFIAYPISMATASPSHSLTTIRCCQISTLTLSHDYLFQIIFFGIILLFCFFMKLYLCFFKHIMFIFSFMYVYTNILWIQPKKIVTVKSNRKFCCNLNSEKIVIL